MSLLILLAVIVLAIASITVKNTVTAMLCFASMMFLLGIYYMILDEKMLGLLQIFVYTGGIVILMLFGITVLGETFPEAQLRPWALVFSLSIGLMLIYLLMSVTPALDNQLISLQSSEIKTTHHARIFTDYYVDFILIFALVGASLLYGSMKMLRFLRGTKSD